MTPQHLPDPSAEAAQLLADLDALPLRSTQPIRAIRRQYSRRLQSADPAYVWEVVLALLPGLRRGTPQRAGMRWIACELIANHQPAFGAIDATQLQTLGAGMQSWDEVDGFGRVIAGPAWLKGRIDDATVHGWARSPDLWWRRAALVCTIALNMRSQGGTGDTPRTLAVCEVLAGDREIMVQKALSWALRELVWHDPMAVAHFVDAHEDALSSLAKREVRHKLTTGLKNRRRASKVDA
jgi:hypothetical protein